MESGLSGAGIKGYPQGVAIGDYDNDGHADVLVTNYGDNVLYHNEGNGRFTDVTARAGVAMPRHPLKASAAFFDYDNDGWLDIFVTHYFQWTFAQNADDWCGRREKGYRIYCDPDAFQPLPNALLRNNRDGTFTDVSAKTGVDRFAGKGMGVAVADYDADGRMDVFVANDRFPHFLYHNEADGTFSEVGFTAGVSANESGTMVSGMGCDFKDFDGDGRPDIFVTDLVHDGFTLFVNQGKGLFVDHSFPSGIGRASAEHSGWSTKFLDIDNDGLKDVFSSGSHVVDNVALYNPTGKYEEGSFLYRNTGEGRIEDLSTRTGPALGEKGAWRGLAVADFDNDGTLEMAVSRLNGEAVAVREEGRGRGQLDPPAPGRVAQQPGRDRRPRAAGVALRPFALRARHDGERDLLGERQARALRVGRGSRDRGHRDHLAERHRAACREARDQPGAPHRRSSTMRVSGRRLLISVLLLALVLPGPRRGPNGCSPGCSARNWLVSTALLAAQDFAAADALLQTLAADLAKDDRLAFDTIYLLLGRGRVGEARAQWNRLAPRLQDSLAPPDAAAPPGAADAGAAAGVAARHD